MVRSVTNTQWQFLPILLCSLLFTVGIQAAPVSPTLIYVDNNATNASSSLDVSLEDPNEDGSWEHPYDSIQEAIDSADSGATLLIRPGTYFENLHLENKALQLIGLCADGNDLPVVDGLGLGPVLTLSEISDTNCLIQGLVLTGGLGLAAGGLVCENSQARLVNCLLTQNQTSDTHGAVVLCQDSHLEIVHCTITDNLSDDQDAALVLQNSTMTLINSIVYHNGGVSIQLQDSNDPVITYSNIEGSWPGTGNIDADPVFDVGTSTDNVRLSSTSPCIDSGDPNTINDALFLDLNGDVRVLNGRADMGADEFDAWASLPAANDPVTIPDASLKAALESALGISDPTAQDLLALTSLAAPDQAIANLSGLEYARNLETLDLQQNDITDITPLAGLKQMRDLDLSSNQIEELSALAAMANLDSLDIHSNDILSLQPLESLAQLRVLKVYSNLCSDLSALARMPQLQELDAHENNISDLSPLTDLTSLQQLDLQDNPLNAAACATDIPAIITNNPDLTISYGSCAPFQLFTSSTSGGAISTPGEGTFIYDYGTVVSITAVADSGHRFVRFTGDVQSTQNPISVSLTSSLQVQARFEAAEGLVDIPDAQLKSIIETALGRTDPTADDMLKLTELDASRSSIKKLDGLEYATNLEWLDVQRNRNIYDLTPLAGLTKMVYLDLNNNRIIDLSPLAAMTQLEYLDIHDNKINGVDALVGMTQMETAILYRNAYSDISGLANMTQVKTLLLYDNIISDISPIANFTNLEELNVLRNPINDEACDVYIPQLIANNPGAKIWYHCGPYLLDLSSTSGGSITTPGEGTFSYEYGTTVTIKAEAGTGYRFTNFSGNVYSTSNPISVTLNTDMTIKANFEAID